MEHAAIVTGASDRIGKAIARYFAGQGMHIALHFNSSASKARETAIAIEKEFGVTCRIFGADFNDAAAVEKLVPEIRQYFFPQILINSASLFYETGFAAQEKPHLDKFFAPNFKAPYLLTHHFARGNPENGLVINMLDTDISGHATAYFDYLLTKKFLATFTEMAAYHLAPAIRVNGVAPGYLLPPKEAGEVSEEQGQELLDELSAKAPLKRQGNTADVVQAVDYLYKNTFVTGQIIYADGGMHLK